MYNGKSDQPPPARITYTRKEGLVNNNLHVCSSMIVKQIPCLMLLGPEDLQTPCLYQSCLDQKTSQSEPVGWLKTVIDQSVHVVSLHNIQLFST